MTDPIRYRFCAVVKLVEERFVQAHVGGALDKAVFRDDSIGWWVIFQGWPSAMFFGAEKPDFVAGDMIDMTAQRRAQLPDNPALTYPVAPLRDQPRQRLTGDTPSGSRLPATAAMGQRVGADTMVMTRLSRDELRSVAKAKGYEGEMCGECGNFSLLRNGSCLKCDTCGATTGCS